MKLFGRQCLWFGRLGQGDGYPENRVYGYGVMTQRDLEHPGQYSPARSGCGWPGVGGNGYLFLGAPVEVSAEPTLHFAVGVFPYRGRGEEDVVHGLGDSHDGNVVS